MAKKALVVDRDYFFVEFMTGILAKRGYDVIKAYNGKEGLSALSEHPLDLMFVDMVMPKIDGWQLIRCIRKKFPTRPFPVIAVSGLILEQLDDLDKLGADYCIAKGPLNRMKDLLADFMDRLEAQPTPSGEDQRIFDLGNLYPRRESMALIETLHFKKAVIESIGIGLMVVDGDGRVLDANPTALGLLKISEAHILNRPVHSVFPPEERDKVVEAMTRITEKPLLGRVVLNLIFSSGGIRLTVSRLEFDQEQKGWTLAMWEAAE